MQAAASFTLGGSPPRPLISTAHAVAGLASALGPWLPPHPLPEQQGVGGYGRIGPCPPGREGARWPVGAVRAAHAITLGVEEEFVLLDPSTG